MTRSTASVLLFASAVAVAVAAPVPKGGPKLEEVFGEIADKKSACKFEMGKDGALTVTVPTTHPAGEPSAGWLSPPLLGKTLEGDFSLSVRVTPRLPNDAGKREKTAAPAVMAGISMLSDDDPTRVGIHVGTVRRLEAGKWVSTQWADYRHLKINGITAYKAGPKEVTDAVYLRMTKRGELVEVGMSYDGTKWSQVVSKQLVGSSGAVRVGPVVYGCIDQEFTATFDQYEIKPLNEEKK